MSTPTFLPPPRISRICPQIRQAVDYAPLPHSARDEEHLPLHSQAGVVFRLVTAQQRTHLAYTASEQGRRLALGELSLMQLFGHFEAVAVVLGHGHSHPVVSSDLPAYPHRTFPLCTTRTLSHCTDTDCTFLPG